MIRYTSLILIILAGMLSMQSACNSSKGTAATADQGEPVDTPKPHKAEMESDVPLEELVTGEWQWAKTFCCGRNPGFTYPEKEVEGYLHLQDNGSYQRNMKGVTESGDYRIGYEVYKQDDRPSITLGNRQPAFVYFRGDTLILDWGYMDLQREYFVRE